MCEVLDRSTLEVANVVLGLASTQAYAQEIKSFGKVHFELNFREHAEKFLEPNGIPRCTHLGVVLSDKSRKVGERSLNGPLASH